MILLIMHNRKKNKKKNIYVLIAIFAKNKKLKKILNKIKKNKKERIISF